MKVNGCRDPLSNSLVGCDGVRGWGADNGGYTVTRGPVGSR